MEAVSGDQKTAERGKAKNAIIPIAILVGSLIFSLAYTGEGDNLREILGTADSYKALMWSSFLGALSAGLITLFQRVILTPFTDIFFHRRYGMHCNDDIVWKLYWLFAATLCSILGGSRPIESTFDRRYVL